MQPAPRLLGQCGCVATAGPSSCVYLEVGVRGVGVGFRVEGVSGPGYPQPCFLLLLASFHPCPWRTRRLRVTSCTCVPGTLSVTGWSTNPWPLTPISRLVSPVTQNWDALLLWASWLGLGAWLPHVPVYPWRPLWSECINSVSRSASWSLGFSLFLSACTWSVSFLYVCPVSLCSVCTWRCVSVSISVPTLLCLTVPRCHSVVCRLC